MNVLTLIGSLTFPGGLFSATAGPLLPDNIAFQPFNKMWQSPSSESLNKSITLDSTESSKEGSPVKKSCSSSRKNSIFGSNGNGGLFSPGGRFHVRKLSLHEPLINNTPSPGQSPIRRMSFGFAGPKAFLDTCTNCTESITTASRSRSSTPLATIFSQIELNPKNIEENTR
jgi:hypothetical protein